MGIHGTQLFNSLIKIANEKEIEQEKIVEILKFSLEKAYLKENPETKPFIEVNEKRKEIKFFEVKTVVDKKEDEIDDDIEISLEDAKKIKSSYKLNDEIHIEKDVSAFEKRVALHVLQIFQQKLNEISNHKIYDEWKDKIGKVVRAEVERVENRFIEINLGTSMGVLLKTEQIPNEVLNPGESYLFLIKEIKEQSKGWPIILSRSDDKFLEYLLSSNIPEIEQGIIEIKLISRVPGFKSKIAIISNDSNIDPIGTCVGMGGKRIKDISAMINNERIDIILYSENPKQLLVNACSPEKIIGLEISDDEEENVQSKIVTIVCNDEDLPKLIGKSGVNVKLLSKLTKWSIDIVPLSIAVEDKIKYEDVSNLFVAKHNENKFGNNFNRKQSNFSSNNSGNRKDSFKNKYQNDEYNNFYTENKNNFSSKWDSSSLSKKVDEITDEDIENLLNFNANNSQKKRKKIITEDDSYENINSIKKNKKIKIDILNEYDNISKDDLITSDDEDLSNIVDINENEY